MQHLHHASILITGGTGSLGEQLARTLLRDSAASRVIIFSRDEHKQWLLRRALDDGSKRLRFFLGDVRDQGRLDRAFRGVDFVVHCAAMKQVDAAEFNPFEAVKTNVLGSQNVIDAAINQKVRRVIALSTDKAANPVSLYGATKLVADRLFIDGNAYAGRQDTRFAVIRFGNLAGSRGSVVPLFRDLAPTGRLPLTDPRMTRFWVTLEQAAVATLDALADLRGGELFVPKAPSVKLTDLAEALAPGAAHDIVGLRPGEKLHEELITPEDAERTYELPGHYLILPRRTDPAPASATKVPDTFRYTSDANPHWLTVDDLRQLHATG